MSIAALSPRTGISFHVEPGGTHLCIGLVAQAFNPITAVQRQTDLFVSCNESLQLSVKFDVLPGKNVTVML